MSKDGVMDQIREHLVQGRSSRELIDLGYRPGSVYGALRQMKGNGTVKAGQTKSRVSRAVEHRDLSADTPGEEGLPKWPVWCVDPPLTCPCCETRVKHWGVCPDCNDLLPLGCVCSEEGSPGYGETYSLRELCSGVSGRSLRITEISP